MLEHVVPHEHMTMISDPFLAFNFVSVCPCLQKESQNEENDNENEAFQMAQAIRE